MNEHKITDKNETARIKPPEFVAIAMQQHIGAPCIPLVKVGDHVTVGQKIGDNDKGLTCPVHASVSGVVERIEKRLVANGSYIEFVVIKNDFEDTLCETLKPHNKPIEETSSEEIIEKVREAGIVGMGGASFPTHAKIKSAVGKADKMIINCAECEPYITSNHRLMLEKPEEIIGGIKILMRATKIKKAIIAVADNKLNAAYKIAELIPDRSLISIEVLKTKYPQGDERQLIFALTGVELKRGQLPADAGFVVFNPESCKAVFETFAYGMPLISKYITVSGECVAQPMNLIVPVGTSFRDAFEFCGGIDDDTEQIIAGGPMMGVAQWDLDTVVLKGTGALLALPSPKDSIAHCIRCGRCAKACQMHLLPLELAKYSQAGDWDMCEELNIMSCVECGGCTYICPGKVPIMQLIRNAKQELKLRAAQKK